MDATDNTTPGLDLQPYPIEYRGWVARFQDRLDWRGPVDDFRTRDNLWKVAAERDARTSLDDPCGERIQIRNPGDV